jgi:hypothetical protein
LCSDLTVYRTAGTHSEMLGEPGAAEIASTLSGLLGAR